MQYSEVYLHPCVSTGGGDDKLLTGLFLVGVRQHRAMCSCEFKNSFFVRCGFQTYNCPETHPHRHESCRRALSNQLQVEIFWELCICNRRNPTRIDLFQWRYIQPRGISSYDAHGFTALMNFEGCKPVTFSLDEGNLCRFDRSVFTW